VFVTHWHLDLLFVLLDTYEHASLEKNSNAKVQINEYIDVAE
jgi:hypothetical protein